MLQIDHRASHDVDIFIDDPQVLSLLNPVVQEYDIAIQPTDYQTDGARALKLVFSGIGEIDFICCAGITSNPVVEMDICGRRVNVETPAEILAKKIFYRSQRLQPRDIFDLVATVRAIGIEAIAPPLQSIAGQCVQARDTINHMSPVFAEKIMDQLMEIRPRFADVPKTGWNEAIEALGEIINHESGHTL